MPTVDDVLAAPALSALCRVTAHSGDRQVLCVRLAEQFTDLDAAPHGSLVLLTRAPSAAAADYRFDMALRWAGIHDVAAIAVLCPAGWEPTATAADIAARAGIALITVPAQTELTELLLAVLHEVGGGAEQALLRAAQGLAAVTAAAEASASIDDLLAAVTAAIGTPVLLHPVPDRTLARVTPDPDAHGTPDHATRGAATHDFHDHYRYSAGRLGKSVVIMDGAPRGPGAVPVVVGESVAGYLTAPEAEGDLAVAVRLVLHAAAGVAARILDLARRARELPIRSRSVLLTELLMSDAALRQDLLDRARRLGIPLDGWHVAIRFEPENLDQVGRDEVHRFELLETLGQSALQAAAGASGNWYLCWVAQAIVLIRMTSSDPGSQAGRDGVRAAERAADAITGRVPALRLRGGVGTPHEGPMGLRASAAEAHLAVATARAAGRTSRVTAHDAAGVQRMLMEWYASDTARASVRSQLEPLERLGRTRGETAIRTLATYLDCQGSVVATARALHLHRNAVSYRLHRITELLGVDLADPDERLALHLACRARLLALTGTP